MTKGRLVLPSPFQGGVGPAHHRRATPDLHRRDRSHRGAGGVGARAEVLRRSSRSMLRSARIPPIAATTCGCGLAEIFPLHMRGLGIGISVFFGWTTNEILALFFRGASRKSASPGRSSCRRRRGGACVRVQGARNAGPFPRCARRGRHDRRDLHRDALRAPSPNTNQLCVLWRGGRPADRILFRANSFTRTPDDFGQTVAPAQTSPLQAARARNSGSHRRGGDRTAGRQPLRRVCFDLRIGVRMYVFRPVYVDMRATSQL